MITAFSKLERKRLPDQLIFGSKRINNVKKSQRFAYRLTQTSLIFSHLST